AEKKKAEDKKKAAEKKKRDEQKRKEAEKKKKQQQADRLAALLDKDPTRQGAQSWGGDPTTDYTGPTAGAREGDAPVLSVREQDLLRAQISSQLRNCWKLPGGGGGIETMVVKIRWRLRPDGSLEGEPSVE